MAGRTLVILLLVVVVSSGVFGRHEPLTKGQHEPLTKGQHEPLTKGQHEPLTKGQHEPLTKGQHEPLTKGQQDTEAPRSLWPDSEAFLLEFEDWFGDPGTRALKGIPNILKDVNPDQLDGERPNLLGVYLPSTDPEIVNNSQCIDDVNKFLQFKYDPYSAAVLARRGEYWPYRITDSWGKLPDGFLYGNTKPWGMMEECTYTKVDKTYGWPSFPKPIEVHFDGRYCLVSYSGLENSTLRTASKQQQQQSTIRDQLARIGVGSYLNLFPDSKFVRYGTCMPDSCNPQDLADSIEANVGILNYVHVDCHDKDETQELYPADIAFIVVVSVLLAVVFVAGVADILINYFDRQKLRRGPLRFLLIWSFYTNMKKMFHINTKQDPEVISCLHGIRVLSMTWVVWAHTYFYESLYSVNLLGIGRLTDDLLEMTINGAYYAVDTFFFISGLLLVYGIMKEYSRVKHVNWIMYYVHRFIRLIPPILMTAGAMATVARLVMVGPLAAGVDRSMVQNCREHWWVDPLFLGNIIQPLCLGQCWYTAVDSQLYILAPLVLAPLVYWPKIGVLWLSAVTVISMLVPMLLTGLLPTVANVMFSVTEYEASDTHTYDRTDARATPYIVGMWAGLLLHHYRDNNKLQLRVWQAAVGWLLASVLGLSVVYSLAQYSSLIEPKPFTLGLSVFYEGFYRGMWGLALLWLVFACHKGYGGPINTFLAHPCWQPLSRLTFALYLVSMSVQVIWPGIVYVQPYANHLYLFIDACGTLFISGLLAVPLSLLTEGPVLGLERLLFRRPGRGSGERQANNATNTTTANTANTANTSPL